MSLLPGLALLFGIAPAQAADHPVFLPTQDVAVTYTLNAPGRAPASYQLEYDAADQRARVDDPAQGMFFLVDLAAGTAQVVIPAMHSVVAAPDFSNLTGQIADADGARFTPLGHGMYAGLSCDKYLVMNGQGTGTACITPEGVVLHFAGHDAHGSAEVTATAVAFGPQPPQDFSAPPGFIDVTLPPGALAQLLRQQ